MEKKVNLLIVDDAAPWRETLGRAMERRGVQVFEASTGVKGVQVYKENKIDIVFLDIKLPDINGLNVFEQIREYDPKAKVFFITGKDSMHFHDKAMELGAAGYMIKPVMLEELLVIVQSVPLDT